MLRNERNTTKKMERICDRKWTEEREKCRERKDAGEMTEAAVK